MKTARLIVLLALLGLAGRSCGRDVLQAEPATGGAALAAAAPAVSTYGSYYYSSIPLPKVTDVSYNGMSMTDMATAWWQLVGTVLQSPNESPFFYDKDNKDANYGDCNIGVINRGDVLFVGGAIGNYGESKAAVTHRVCKLAKPVKGIFVPILNGVMFRGDPSDAPFLADVSTATGYPGGFMNKNSYINVLHDPAILKSAVLELSSQGRTVTLGDRPSLSTAFIRDKLWVVTPYFAMTAVPGSSFGAAGTYLDYAQSVGYYAYLDVSTLSLPLQLHFAGYADFGGGSFFSIDIRYTIKLA